MIAKEKWKSKWEIIYIVQKMEYLFFLRPRREKIRCQIFFLFNTELVNSFFLFWLLEQKKDVKLKK